MVWLVMALLLIVGGLSWAILAARSRGQSNPTASGAPTDLRSDNESANSHAAEAPPKDEPANSGAAEPLPPDSALANLVIEDGLTDAEKTGVEKTDTEKSEIGKTEPGTTPQAKPDRKVEAENVSPPGRAEIAPPVISTNVPVFTPGTDSPAKHNEYAPDNMQLREPAPAPQQTERPTVLKTIRKSGDVLQNTAIIRPRPVYPKAAREANVKGTVTVEVTIDEEGSVIAARPISGPEQLRDAALAAARRWKWVPESVDRKRARVVGTITLSFKD
jgi:TonB family protein